MTPRDRERIQEKANWCVHTVLYEQDQEAIYKAWKDINRLPWHYVLTEVQYYDPASVQYFAAWYQAKDLLQYLVNISDPGPKE